MVVQEVALLVVLRVVLPSVQRRVRGVVTVVTVTVVPVPVVLVMPVSSRVRPGRSRAFHRRRRRRVLHTSSTATVLAVPILRRSSLEVVSVRNASRDQLRP